jgi:hypothetical protein
MYFRLGFCSAQIFLNSLTKALKVYTVRYSQSKCKANITEHLTDNKGKVVLSKQVYMRYADALLWKATPMLGDYSGAIIAIINKIG